MIRTKIARAAAVVAVLGTAGLASPARAGHEKDEVPSSYTALTKMSPTEVMHMIDKDKKGYVTREEFLKFQGSLFDKIDKNRDGRLVQPEFTDRG